MGSILIQFVQSLVVFSSLIQCFLVFPIVSDLLRVDSSFAKAVQLAVGDPGDFRLFLAGALWLIMPLVTIAAYKVSVRALPPTIAVCGGGLPASAVLTHWQWSIAERIESAPISPFREFDVCCMLPETSVEDKVDLPEHRTYI